jgi:very-short-patch-repair endonuclease
MGRVRLPDTILADLEARGLVAPGTGSTAPRAPRRGRSRDWPAELAEQCRHGGLQEPVREYRFHPVRRWRFDLCWPWLRVACEVDGGAFIGGRHTSGAGFREDCIKLSEAAALGYRVLRVMPEHVESGQALSWLQAAILGGPPWPPAP